MWSLPALFDRTRDLIQNIHSRVTHTEMASSEEQYSSDSIRQVKVNPDYLHGSSTCHTWVFSAVAELIDNSYDANSKELKIDIETINGQKCLTFVDNGCGMDGEELFKMLSYGYCTKFYKGRKQIGQFGSGFKTGSMRLGVDALVFTRCLKDGKHKPSACVGFLSQTYLKDIKADSVQVPILQYTIPGLKPVEDSKKFYDNMEDILKYSPYADKTELQRELRSITTSGTKIVIFGLQTLSDGSKELDLVLDPLDIICPHDESTPRHKYSLREYCSVLFYRPRMRIVLRGERVRTQLMTSSLSNPWTTTYQASGGPKTNVTFGQSWETDPASQYYGMMLYHNNRLITAFEKLKLQRHAQNPEGAGVIGVTQVNFLDPIHNKQDFQRDKKFDNAMNAYNDKLKEYLEFLSSQPVSTCKDNWVQCDHCLKWRKLPEGFDTSTLPEEWFCVNNPDKEHNECHIDEEVEKEAPKARRVKRKSGERSSGEQVFKHKKRNFGSANHRAGR